MRRVRCLPLDLVSSSWRIAYRFLVNSNTQRTMMRKDFSKMSDTELNLFVVSGQAAQRHKPTELLALPTETLQSLEQYCIRTARAVARELGRRQQH